MIVLTNDDGIDAPGILALQRAVAQQPTAIVAPDRPLSGCSHQLTRGRAITLEQRAPQEHAVTGTPADCTRIATSHLYPEATWVLSGINAGGNLGADTYVSGTVAAIREATLLRIPGIAISQYIQDRRPIDWQIATRLATRVLAQLMDRSPTAGRFWNVNLPHLCADDPEPAIVDCPVCTQPLPTEFTLAGNQLSYTGRYSQRARDRGADVDICFTGNISVSEIRLW